ncbi:unnamed protein product [Zymoseptoria tritici ST99CH_1A5]|uniref:Aminoglycoside phosphotransferase domain-containing protein n=3 Tax=Zymoseptoria tritici TaxID=1047171 RepID=A0A1X7S2J2_ZYMT9|nr:unnamed protein product [Zymoseptoria tritici ST99CH_3D7]SMR58307.1 unnamed protein product [Zymoseptoria tritici ST99CH_1E4]SMY27503.1 unnamed protein product [Zymoseptoria tritici ST99CH_1A5]
MLNQYGLEWEGTLSGLEPRWTTDPDLSKIDGILRQHLNLDVTSKCALQFFAQGGFNKLYSVSTDAGQWLMRVALPVDPQRKTASEVATMNFVRESTTTPIPSVRGHSATNENALGFEWILMEMMPGMVLERRWRQMSMEQKKYLVKQLAQYQSQLFAAESRYQSIGNLYQPSSERYEVGSIVSMSFFWGDRGAQDSVNRGPFMTSHAWLSARLNLVLDSQAEILPNPDSDEDDIEDAEAIKALAERLLALLPSRFPADEVQSTMLFHDDLHANNILVSSEDPARITAILDWECVSFLPLWMACQPPALLEGRVRDKAPQRDIYAAHDPELDGPDEEDHAQGKTTLYWEHQLEYERGVLRPMFLQEMLRLQPAWMEVFRDGEAKREFELAVQHCDGLFTVRTVGRWVDEVEKGGESGSLREILYA